MLLSSFILNEVILGAHFILFVSEFHEVSALKLRFFSHCFAVLYENLKGLVSSFVVITIHKN